jgi:KUP system potassium uptake protein
MKYCLNPIGDYKFVLGDSYLSNENNLSEWKKILLSSYYKLKEIAINEEENFGLEESNVWVEKYPLIVSPVKNLSLKRSFV